MVEYGTMMVVVKPTFVFGVFWLSPLFQYWFVYFFKRMLLFFAGTGSKKEDERKTVRFF